jgi:hypothetical protein
MNIQELEKELQFHKSEVERIQELICESLGNAAGIHVGDIVIHRTGDRYRVSRISGDSDDTSLSLYGNAEKKSGWSRNETYVGILGYSCELEKKPVDDDIEVIRFTGEQPDAPEPEMAETFDECNQEERNGAL